MKTPKFIPGPWVSETPDNPESNHVIYTLQDPRGFANVYCGEKSRANAALIAAAPEMWALLSRVAAGEDVRNEAERLLTGLNA